MPVHLAFAVCSDAAGIIKHEHIPTDGAFAKSFLFYKEIIQVPPTQ